MYAIATRTLSANLTYSEPGETQPFYTKNIEKILTREEGNILLSSLENHIMENI
jgi:hypothetical protein